MGVYFALRTHYDYPTGKYLRYFPGDDTVLSWFQRHWIGKSQDNGESSAFADEILGCSVYGFASLFESLAEHDLNVPKTMRQLSAILHRYLYVEGEVRTSANAIQVLTDDDELELAYYFFDDTYVAQKPEKAAFLLHEDWRLPPLTEPTVGRVPTVSTGVTSLASGAKGPGNVYCVFLTFYDSASLTDIEGSYRIAGIVLPQFVDYLRENVPDEEWLPELKLLRSLTVSATEKRAPSKTLGEIVTEAGGFPLSELNYASDWSGLGQSDPATDRKKIDRLVAKIQPERALLSGTDSLVQAEEHIAQLCLHTSTLFHGSDDGTKLFTRWIFFDDIWLRAHPALGKAILRFGTRWDVLT